MPATRGWRTCARRGRATPVLYSQEEAFPAGRLQGRGEGQGRCGHRGRGGHHRLRGLKAAAELKKEGIGLRVIDAYSVAPSTPAGIRREVSGNRRPGDRRSRTTIRAAGWAKPSASALAAAPSSSISASGAAALGQARGADDAAGISGRPTSCGLLASSSALRDLIFSAPGFRASWPVAVQGALSLKEGPSTSFQVSGMRCFQG